MARLMDPRDKNGLFPFQYVPAVESDVRKTWERARQQIEEQKKREKENAAWRLRNVIKAKAK